MTARTKKTRIKQFGSLVEKWAILLRLSNWSIRLTEGDAGEKLVTVSEEFVAAAETAVDFPYEMAHVILNNVETYLSLNAIACHELVHLVLSPYEELIHQIIDTLPEAEQLGFKRWAFSVEERVTTHLEKALMGMEGLDD